MLIIGLTGSIATGKSTVSSMLSSPPHSLPIIDADLLARKVVEPGTRAYARILSHFLATTPDLLLPPSEDMPPSGATGKGRPLNRPALGRRVFGDGEEERRNRAVLNGIVHPAVRWEMLKGVVGAYLRGHWAVVLDVPLLFEGGLDVFCGTTVVVGVKDRETQLERLMGRDGHLSREEAEGRVGSQEDVGVKAARSLARGGVVIWNDGTTEDLEVRLGEEVERLKESMRLWRWLEMVPLVGVLVGTWRVWRNVRMNREWERAK